MKSFIIIEFYITNKDKIKKFAKFTLLFFNISTPKFVSKK